jgi:hypothetical protein
MSLSSNSLFHFTKTKESLFGILKEGFRVRYCPEDMIIGNLERTIAIPMVCFCDIPLGESKIHRQIYGDCGIGLKKQWAIENGLNPVLYIEKESEISDYFNVVYKHLSNSGMSAQINHELKDSLLNIFSYIKNYENYYDYNQKFYLNYRFYDEREWRYTPSIAEAEPAFTRSIGLIESKQNKIDHLRLKFSFEDLSYIILNNKCEKEDLIRLLKAIYNDLEVEQITPNIFTIEEIQELI